MSIGAHRACLATAMGLPVERFAQPGTTVVAGEDRRGSGLASHYRVDRHSVVWVDPEIADRVEPLDGGDETWTFEGLRQWMAERDFERLGAAYEHVLTAAFDAPARPAAITVLDGTSAEASRLVSELNGACSEHDRDQADFHPDALDHHLVGWLDEGRLLAVGGGRPFEPRPGFLDVGVLVHPDHRARGLGRAVIAALVTEVLAAGHRPLYRCNVENEGSWRLCRGLGFEAVLELDAHRSTSAR